MKTKQMALVPRERIVRAIHVFREERVMLDATLAELYAVETRALIQAVKRNLTGSPVTSCSSSPRRNPTV